MKKPGVWHSIHYSRQQNHLNRNVSINMIVKWIKNILFLFLLDRIKACPNQYNISLKIHIIKMYIVNKMNQKFTEWSSIKTWQQWCIWPLGGNSSVHDTLDFEGNSVFTRRATLWLPSWESSFQGMAGYIKDAFWIWSLISSSSLNGNVPLKLKTTTTE